MVKAIESFGNWTFTAVRRFIGLFKIKDHRVVHALYIIEPIPNNDNVFVQPVLLLRNGYGARRVIRETKRLMTPAAHHDHSDIFFRTRNSAIASIALLWEKGGKHNAEFDMMIRSLRPPFRFKERV